jgi:hypothetical protein
MATLIQRQLRTLGRTGCVPQTGLLVDVGADGSPRVEYSGNQFGPIGAKTAIPSARKGDTVLLVFDQGDPARPIIIGVVRDHFEKGFPSRLRMAAKEIVLEGAEEVILRCGESSLTLRKDGKTVLKGNEVVSRASRTNRIRGATVQIN